VKCLVDVDRMIWIIQVKFAGCLVHRRSGDLAME
jgi:hypothetical protein